MTFEEYYNEQPEDKGRTYSSEALKALCKAAWNAAMEEAARIAALMEVPKSIGRDHGAHHRAGLQRAARAIRAAKEREGKQ